MDRNRNTCTGASCRKDRAEVQLVQTIRWKDIHFTNSISLPKTVYYRITQPNLSAESRIVPVFFVRIWNRQSMSKKKQFKENKQKN